MKIARGRVWTGAKWHWMAKGNPRTPNAPRGSTALLAGHLRRLQPGGDERSMLPSPGEAAMSAISTARPRRAFAKRFLDGLAQWALCAPLAVVAILAMNAAQGPVTPPPFIATVFCFGFFSMLSFGVGVIAAGLANPDYQRDQTFPQLAKGLAMFPAWLLGHFFMAFGCLAGVILLAWAALAFLHA